MSNTFFFFNKYNIIDYIFLKIHIWKTNNNNMTYFWLEPYYILFIDSEQSEEFFAFKNV